MNYFAKEDRGEICFKGHNVFVGYLNNAAKTAEAFDSGRLLLFLTHRNAQRGCDRPKKGNILGDRLGHGGRLPTGKTT